MITEGFKLLFLGMGVVFTFLILLQFIIKLAAVILAPYTQREIAAYTENKIPSVQHLAPLKRPDKGKDNAQLMAIITAAIATHRNSLISKDPPSTP